MKQMTTISKSFLFRNSKKPQLDVVITKAAAFLFSSNQLFSKISDENNHILFIRCFFSVFRRKELSFIQIVEIPTLNVII